MKRFAIAIIVAFSLCSVSFAKIVRGTNGPNVNWEYNTDTRVFTLSGEGTRWLSDSSQVLPWYGYLQEIRAVRISSEVRYLGNWAFAGSNSITEVHIPKKLLDVGIGTFWNCSALAEPIYNDSVFIFFPPKYGQKNYALPNGPKYVACAAFFGCEQLEAVTIPESYLFLDPYAFAGCTQLQRVTFKKSHPFWIGNGCFQNCTNLNHFRMPEGIMKIGDGAFIGCGLLPKVALPLGATHIGKQAFSGCSSIKKAALPITLELIDEGAFNFCDELKSVKIPRNCKVRPNAFPQTTNVKRGKH